MISQLSQGIFEIQGAKTPDVTDASLRKEGGDNKQNYTGRLSFTGERLYRSRQKATVPPFISCHEVVLQSEMALPLPYLKS